MAARPGRGVGGVGIPASAGVRAPGGGRRERGGGGSWKLLPLLVLAACMMFYIGSNLAIMNTGMNPQAPAPVPAVPKPSKSIVIPPPLAWEGSRLLEGGGEGGPTDDPDDPLVNGPYHYPYASIVDDDEALIKPVVTPPPSPGPPPSGKLAQMDCSKIKKGEGADNIRNIAYWMDDPKDKAFRSPLVALGPKDKYVTFEPDHGGWNNIRMAMECVLMFAASTGRTLVLPPEQPMYLLQAGEVHFEDFFPVELLGTRMSVINTHDFLEIEGKTGKLGVLPPQGAIDLVPNSVYRYYEAVGGQYGEHGLPALNPGRTGIVLPFDLGGAVDPKDKRWVGDEFTGWLSNRRLVEYDKDWQDTKVVHWRAADKSRLLSHFYTWVKFADRRIDNYYKRMVRDIWHYRDEIFCKASQVISMILAEIPENGTYSSMHIRRGDFQFTAVRMPPQEIFDESADHLLDKEWLYISTDERNKSFFDPFYKRYNVRFLDNYYERAGIDELSKNFVGMVEQVIASHGRTFTGTWWSTFTGYILRMRGYLGKPRTSNYYFFPEKRDYPHLEQWPEPPFWMTEWYQGWEGINDEGPPDLDIEAIIKEVAEKEAKAAAAPGVAAPHIDGKAAAEALTALARKRQRRRRRQ